MTLQSVFDFAKPFDIMVGHWVGTASIYDPAGTYLLSTKSYVSVYWKSETILSFRESAEDIMEYQGEADDYVNPRSAAGCERITKLLAGAPSKTKRTVSNSSALRDLTYDFVVKGMHCQTDQTGPISVSGRQSRPDAYQFHVKKEKNKNGKVYYHHVFNSHHFPNPEDWQIIGPIVGPVWIKDAQGQEVVNSQGDEKIGLSVVQNFRRISYSVPRWAVVEYQAPAAKSA